MTKAISEAIFFATAACFERVNLFKGISDSVTNFEFSKPKMTKLLINVLNGGKILGSTVKFSRFYLIIDGNEASKDVDITEAFIKFTHSIRKTVQNTKTGVSETNL